MGDIERCGLSSDNQALASSICISCGLCCNGTLFRQARVFPHEDAVAIGALGFRVNLLKDGRRNFPLPCRYLQGTVCSIYAETRPDICPEYRCKLLKRFISGELPLDDALDLVARAVAHADQVRRDLSGTGDAYGVSIDNLFARWKQGAGSNVSSVEMNYHALLFRLNRDFREKKEK